MQSYLEISQLALPDKGGDWELKRCFISLFTLMTCLESGNNSQEICNVKFVLREQHLPVTHARCARALAVTLTEVNGSTVAATHDQNDGGTFIFRFLQ